MGITTYQWTNNNSNIIYHHGNGNIPSFIAINTTTAPITATITVTPYFTNNGITCSGNSENFYYYC